MRFRVALPTLAVLLLMTLAYCAGRASVECPEPPQQTPAVECPQPERLPCLPMDIRERSVGL